MDINILEKTIQNRKLIVTVDIDGEREEFVTDNPTPGWLNRQIESSINKRQSVINYEKSVKIGTYTIPVTVPSLPTPEELKRQEFNKKYEELQKKQGYLSSGLLQESDLTLLKEEVKQLAIEIGEI